MLMLSSHNILSPAHGGPVTVPTQDMVLGLYYLTKSRSGAKGEGMVFSSPAEVRQAFDLQQVAMHAKITVRLADGTKVNTSVGRVLFNEFVPPQLGFINDVLTKKNLRRIIASVLTATNFPETARFLDGIKQAGFEFATMGRADILYRRHRGARRERRASQ